MSTRGKVGDYLNNTADCGRCSILNTPQLVIAKAVCSCNCGCIITINFCINTKRYTFINANGPQTAVTGRDTCGRYVVF